MDGNLNNTKDQRNYSLLVLALLLGFVGGLIGGGVINKGGVSFSNNQNINKNLLPPKELSSEPVVNVVEKSSPAVVAIVITKNVATLQAIPFDPFNNGFFGPFQFRIQQPGTPMPREVGGGSGFVVDKNGLIVTNKHVVSDTNAQYEVIFKNGDRIPGKVVAQDPVLDLAIIKVDRSNLPTISLAKNNNVKVGQTVVAIGNALGEFPNTVSSGVISGLGRQVQAGDSLTGEVEVLNQVIQTDAAINPGNSGGPLLDLSGEAIGVNTAVAGSAQNIGFAIPASEAAKALASYQSEGKITRPVLGVRYALIDSRVKNELKLDVSEGAVIVKGNNNESAILPGSGAEKAGLKEGEVILEADGQKIDENHPLQEVVQNKKPGDTVELLVLSGGVQKKIKVGLTEAK